MAAWGSWWGAGRQAVRRRSAPPPAAPLPPPRRALYSAGSVCSLQRSRMPARLTSTVVRARWSYRVRYLPALEGWGGAGGTGPRQGRRRRLRSGSPKRRPPGPTVLVSQHAAGTLGRQAALAARQRRIPEGRGERYADAARRRQRGRRRGGLAGRPRGSQHGLLGPAAPLLWPPWLRRHAARFGLAPGGAGRGWSVPEEALQGCG